MSLADSLRKRNLSSTGQGYSQYTERLNGWSELIPSGLPEGFEHDSKALLAWTDSLLKRIGEQAKLLRSPIQPVKKVEILGEQLTGIAALLPVLLLAQLNIEDRLHEISKSILTR